MPRQGEINHSTVDLLKSNNNIELLEPFKGTKQHHKMKCLVCNHVWSATPLSKTQTFKKYGVGGCPKCKEDRSKQVYQTKRQVNLQRLSQRGIEILTSGFDGRRHLIDESTYTKLLVRNIHCGHTFECSPSNLLSRNVECGVCGPQKRVEPLTAWSKANSAKWKETATEWQIYKATVSSLTLQTYKQHKKLINPDNLPRGKAGIFGAYHLDHIVPKRFCFENKIPPETCADKSNLQMMGWRENVGSRNHLKGTIPPLFLQYLSAHDRMKAYRNALTIGDYKQFYKLGDTTVDLYSETNNHAIVLIPLDQTQANSKTASTMLDTLKSQGVTTTFIFEDELSDLSLIKSKLSHRTQNNNVQRIHARNCDMLPCLRQEKATFLNKHHNQGNDNAQVAYGAYYQKRLVAIMTFSAPRAGIGKHKNKREGTYELVRFATDTSFRVPGIASRLLKHFQRNHTWREIYSYADRRWSEGGLYEKLGFTLERVNPPDYFYVVNGKRMHRWNYRKDIIKKTLPNYDPLLTEYQNMTNSGLWRVWDCGTLKYVMKNITE